MNKSKIYYLTYQDFPANTANSQQTISTCKYLAKNNIKVKLIFPLRSQNSSSDLDKIFDFYNFEEKLFTIVGLPFYGKFQSKYFKKFNYLYKHISWSYYAVNNILKSKSLPDAFITRSDWIYYFLSRKNLNVTYECHKLTKLRKFILKKSINYKNSKIIFLNKKLLLDSGLKKYDKNKILIQNGGYDDEFFQKKFKKNQKTVIFTGNLYRLGKERNLNFVINAFQDKRLRDFNLKIIGGTENDLIKFNKQFSDVKNVTFKKYLSKDLLSIELGVSEIGLLINDNNYHSMYHTDPLKYYEYIASDLKIIAIDFPSHREFEKNGNIVFFDHNNYESFIKALLKISESNFSIDKNLQITTQDQRVKNMINFIL